MFKLLVDAEGDGAKEVVVDDLDERVGLEGRGPAVGRRGRGEDLGDGEAVGPRRSCNMLASR